MHRAKPTFFLCTWLAAIACSDFAQQPSLADDPAGIEFFEKHIRPILVDHCYECHSGAEIQGGLRIDDRPSLLRGGDSGPVVVVSKPDESLLIAAVRYSNPDLQMPPSGQLSTADVDKLAKWVAMGVPDPRQAMNDPTSPKPTGMSIEQGRTFWSMRPIADPPLPKVRDTHWLQTPIDAFVLAGLESAGLKPANISERATLLRRISLDLVGLPPSIEEISEFERDAAPDAYERQIDRLLSSPQYGVRWGRHWLDVARYADSNGLDENIAFGNAWRYRDYVVDSFNSDKPLDRFVEEQLAGDLLHDSDQEAKTGTGFLVLGAKVLAEPDREKLNMDTIDEQLDTIGKAFLGLTLGCARCHDHKFDPIHQSDYYALAAIFKGTRTFGNTNFGAIKHWNEISFADASERETLRGIDARIAEKQAAWNNAKGTSFNQLREQTRRNAAHYLATAARLPADASLAEWTAIAAEIESESSVQLHPRILSHCRRHLEFHRDDPLFQQWHAHSASGDLPSIASHYKSLFDDVQAAWDKKKAEDPSATKLDDPFLEAARVALNDPSGFLAAPAKMEHALDDATIAALHASATELRLFESSAPDETAVMGVSDDNVVTGLPIHIRGSHRNLGPLVARNFPAVMRDASSNPILSKRKSGRLELARWMTNPTHPLLARVYVNRIWRWHFGRGIVATTENFGVLGDLPSHPELLDHLARTFIESGWSTKELHRSILRSATYQMSAAPQDPDRSLQFDSDNRLLSRFKPQRLEAEQIRDSILWTADQLDLRMGGKTVPLRNRQFVFDHTSVDHTRYDSHRRAIYLPIIRNHLYSVFEQFDYPDPTMPTGDRQSTTIAPQALLLMNSDWVMDAAEQLATHCEKLTSSESKADWLYQRILGRMPSVAEKQSALSFVQNWGALATASVVAEASVTRPEPQPAEAIPIHDRRESGWQMLAHALLINNEFFYVR